MRKIFARLFEKIHRPSDLRNLRWWALLMIVSIGVLTFSTSLVGLFLFMWVPLLIVLLYTLSRFTPLLAAILGGTTVSLIIVYLWFSGIFWDDAVGIFFVGIALGSPLGLIATDLSRTNVLATVAIVISWAIYGALASIIARRLKERRTKSKIKQR